MQSETNGAVLSSGDESSALRMENMQLRQELDRTRRLLGASKPCKYKIDKYNAHLDGACQGKWRLRYGLRVIGSYETEDEAKYHLALHWSQLQRRIRVSSSSREHKKKDE